ncbi:MAG: hypothetical protein KC421_00530, partial [Anaerolineales bacterium]|nr:hypothetical protein [Anaerolineales bacterium]
KGERIHPIIRSPHRPFILAGLFAGLSIHTYMAARAVPIFYGLFVMYLAVWQRELLRQKWRGLVWFTAVFALTASPLVIYLLTNPGAEFRIEEVSAPLNALLAGDLRPVLENSVKILGMFGWAGDPLWRQNVAGRPVFEPVVAVLFYVGVLVALWRWKDARYAFALLWLTTSTIPSLVTINAPSTIRIINALPLLTLFPALLIHILRELSTDNPHLSTVVSKLGVGLVLTVGAVYAIRTGYSVFRLWPNGGDVPFVWQAAFTETAVTLDTQSAPIPTAIGGWSPDTMDPNTMALLLRRDDVPLSHFSPEDGTLILPTMSNSGEVVVIRPSILNLHPHWEQQLQFWNAEIAHSEYITQYTLSSLPTMRPQHTVRALFGDQLRLDGYDLDCDTAVCRIITYWQVETVPANATRLFVQLLDDAGNVAAEDYHLDNLDPQSLWVPHWQVGDRILQIHEFQADLNLAAAMRVGFFDPYSCEPGPCQNLLTDTGAPFLLLSLHE